MSRNLDSQDEPAANERKQGGSAFPNAVTKASSIEQAVNRDAAQRQRQEALERRLVQLRTAMGEPEPEPEPELEPTSAPAALAPVAPPSPDIAVTIEPGSSPAPLQEQEAAMEPPFTSAEPPRRTGKWLGLALIPVVAVAGTLWWKAQDAPALDPAPPVAEAAAPTPVPVAPPAEAPVLAAAEPAPVAPSPDASASAPLVAESATTPVATQAPAEIPVAADNAEDRALAILENWRAAWSNRDADTYLSHYSDSFVAANGQDRASWAESRRQNFGSRDSISVKTYEVHVTRLDDNRIQLAFLQDYESGGYREKAQPKVFLLIQEAKDWRIAGEWQGRLTVPASGKS